ncbi:MAG: hypothetical protein ACRD8W_01640 [Nitrososphaeraceae archaeon]
MVYINRNDTGSSDSKVHDISYQLGAYYDLRYMQYFTRCKFILGLSNYNDDDIILDREYEMEEGGKNYRCNFLLECEIQTLNSERSEREDYDLVNDPAIQAFSEIAEHFYDPYDKVVREFLIHTYPDINEQELHICRTIVGVIWDIGTPYYMEVVARIVKDTQIEWRKLFGNIKNIEDTIQRLVYKGILSQEIAYICNGDKNGDTRWRHDEPLIVLDFIKDPSEVMIAISEIFGQMIKSFIGPRINYATASNKLEG